VAVQRADADAGPPGDVVEGDLDAPFGEQLDRGAEDRLALAAGIGTHRAPTGGRGRRCRIARLRAEGIARARAAGTLDMLLTAWVVNRGSAR
jgi:hypothetical protein